ncbi:abortive infection bacteriophage resistance protein [Secundilactobacillus pentosiphilus]|uniref:Abortive infection bacteriophage resistance protein n=1 Tax=Secundilactobacillus pentosiphilus TaxID=1714682 RepID=A0A1Z5IRP4_9LACO|nr:Abi family protein [Secundilactobacillus pentosiphilus]GAX04409.1 abortive infection bacteriophage resistance protein [Secundilactobacillus pentosiphilus]
MVEYSRKATRIDEQLHILNARGLRTENNLENQQRLENIGYFKFKGYCLPFYEDSSNDVFIAESTFEDVYASYIVDQKLHRILYGLLSRIESQLKSIIGSKIALEYGPLSHYDEKIFRSSQYQADWLAALNVNENRAQERRELYVDHYKKVYEDKVPIWVALEMATLGTVSKLFSDIRPELQKEIAVEKYSVPYVYLASWLQFLTVVRNSCAHNNRTFGRKFSISPKIAKKVKNKCPELEYPTIFTVFYVISKVCKSRNFLISSIEETSSIFANTSNVDISKFGFPENWREQIDTLS